MSFEIPYKTLTPILGDAATYNPTIETTPKFINDKFNELLENDKALENQINVLTEKQYFSLTPITGYTITKQSCYKLGDKYYIYAIIQKSDDSAMKYSDHFSFATLPYTFSNLQPINCIGYNNSFYQNDGKCFVSESTLYASISRHDIYRITIKGVVE